MVTAANLVGFGLNTLQAIYAKDMVKPENQARILNTLSEAGKIIRHPIEKIKQFTGHFGHSLEK